MGKLLLENLTNYCYYNHFFILKKNIMIHLEHNTIEIVFSSDLEVEAEQLQKRMLFLYIKKKKTTEIRLITRNDSSLTTTEIELKKPKLNFNLHIMMILKKFIKIFSKISVNKIPKVCICFTESPEQEKALTSNT